MSGRHRLFDLDEGFSEFDDIGFDWLFEVADQFVDPLNRQVRGIGSRLQPVDQFGDFGKGFPDAMIKSIHCSGGLFEEGGEVLEHRFGGFKHRTDGFNQGIESRGGLALENGMGWKGGAIGIACRKGHKLIAEHGVGSDRCADIGGKCGEIFPEDGGDADGVALGGIALDIFPLGRSEQANSTDTSCGGPSVADLRMKVNPRDVSKVNFHHSPALFALGPARKSEGERTDEEETAGDDEGRDEEIREMFFHRIAFFLTRG